MRRITVFLLLFSFLLPSADAQTQRPQKSSLRKSSNGQKRPPEQQKPTITVDTLMLPPEIAMLRPPDTARRDTATTILEKVADVVHDSVKAQLKAPIVQVPVRLKTLIIPGVLFAYGVVTQNNGGLRIFNDETRKALWDGHSTYSHPYIEDYLLLVPAAAVYGMNIFGLHGRNNLIDRSIIYGMSNGIANGFIFGLKYFGIEERPDATDNYSFASGHTAEAFVSAEFLHQEYKGRVHWTVTAAGYAVAVGVGYLRIYHNKHWLSDVVAGAGIGMASTRFSYYLYPIIKHALFGSKTVREDVAVYPMYQMGGGYGVGMIYKF